MSLYLDSANLQEAKEAAKLGFVVGITTNPTLLAKETTEPLEHIRGLTEVFSGKVFYQLTKQEPNEMLIEAQQVYAMASDRIVLKIPATLQGFALIKQLGGHIPCAVTALFSAQQGWLAAQVGAKYVIPYVSRTARLGGDPYELIRQITALLKGTETEILAASVKTEDEALKTLLAGATHLTVPLALIQQMAQHKWSTQAIDEFASPGTKVEEKQAKTPPKTPPAKEAATTPQTPPTFSRSAQTPFDMLDYILGKIQVEELLAQNSEKELKEYLAQRELDKLKEEEEINIRLEELKKRLGK